MSRALAGVKVRLQRWWWDASAAEGVGAWQKGTSEETVTNEKGEYRFEGVLAATRLEDSATTVLLGYTVEVDGAENVAVDGETVPGAGAYPVTLREQGNIPTTSKAARPGSYPELDYAADAYPGALGGG